MLEMQIAFALKVSVRKSVGLVMFLGVVSVMLGKTIAPLYKGAI